MVGVVRTRCLAGRQIGVGILVGIEVKLRLWPTFQVANLVLTSFLGLFLMEEESPDDGLATVVTDETFHSLDASIRSIWRIKLAGLTALLFFPVFFYDLTHLFAQDPWIPFGVLSGTVLGLGLLYTIVWPRLRYRVWRFALRPEELYMEHGVITHVRTVVPLRRIQHIDVSQDLVEREFDLGRLVVHTAGSRSSDVVIPGLPLPDAERIRDEVKRFILEDPLTEDPV